MNLKQLFALSIGGLIVSQAFAQAPTPAVAPTVKTTYDASIGTFWYKPGANRNDPYAIEASSIGGNLSANSYAVWDSEENNVPAGMQNGVPVIVRPAKVYMGLNPNTKQPVMYLFQKDRVVNGQIAPTPFLIADAGGGELTLRDADNNDTISMSSATGTLTTTGMVISDQLMLTKQGLLVSSPYQRNDAQLLANAAEVAQVPIDQNQLAGVIGLNRIVPDQAGKAAVVRGVEIGAHTGVTLSDAQGNETVTLDSNTGEATVNGVVIRQNGSFDANGVVLEDLGTPDGTRGGDAVNVAYLQSELAKVNGGNVNINNQVNHLNNRLGRIEGKVKDLSGGIAQALAAAGLPQSVVPGRSMLSGALSSYDGRLGFAVGLSHRNESGRVTTKLNVSGDNVGKLGITVGAGYQF